MRHCFVIYRNHRKSLWQTDHDASAIHMLSFLDSVNADYNYYPPFNA